VTAKAFQDCYPDNYAHCYGCGRLNAHGLQIKSYWEGEESVCRFEPRPYHTGGFPDYLYGGLIASLIDCHGAGTAAAAKAREEGIDPQAGPFPRFVTASLKVDYLAPTPVGGVLELRARVSALSGRKALIAVELSAGGRLRARGEVLMIQIPERTPAAPAGDRPD
jgi:acyl-coenzyme A thioesterase PaaI-like protein